MKPNDRTERERALFEHALDLPTDAERHAYLARACAGNDTLRATVEELLRHHAAEDFLSGPAVVEGPPTFVEPSRIVECPGSRIGHYKLLQQIGEGGCGVVYMAEQEEPVRRRVALKIIKPGMDTRSVIARFEAERQALAMMDHPNIAHVLDAGATDSGRPYFVMELVRGIRITEYCDQNKLSTAARLKLFTQVCQAVQHAHQKGIIHRDLKPSNILVTVNDGVPVPKVIDFGIAKAVEGRLTDQTLFTAFEQFLGTPAYMSPEQAAMTSLDVDTRSDIYSLGVLLYELLTGRTPFDQKELMRGGLDGMRRVLREQEPQRPSTRLSTLANGDRATIAAARASDLSGLVTSITGDLDWIVMRCLEKDRTRRYETANGLAADIQRHLDNEPVVARPPSRIYTLQKLVRRNQLAVAAATAVLVALLVGLGIASWAFVRERSARQRAALEAARSRQTAEFLQEMLQGVGPSVALGRDTTLLREILDRTAARLSTDLKDQPEVEAELRDTIGRVYEEFAEHERARAMHERAVELRQKLYGEDHTNTARSVRLLGTSRNSIYLSGELEQQRETERLLRQALATQRKFLGETNLEVADTLMQLSYALLNLGQRDDLERAQLKQLNEEAVESSQRVVDIHRKYFTGDHPTLARSLRELGHSFARADRAAEGEPYYREALAMQRRLLGEEHLEVAHAMRYMAFGLYQQRKYEESERLYRQALAQYRKYLGNDNRHVASVLMELGNVFTSQERWDEAANLAAELVACERRRTGPETVE
ncbi:MAG: serine/threonine protein kinase, partial [Verrucomicrobiales bacterium]|nr:serine/threonine protein kinase [Verrucomicrobiales bacterium]